MYKVCGLLLIVCLLNIASAGGVNIVPTTTLAAETANNTSASNQFLGSSNGKCGSGAGEQAAVDAICYIPARTRKFTSTYSRGGATPRTSTSATIRPIRSRYIMQIEDMISRGINGIFVDWYGIKCPNMTQCNHENAATIALLNEAEQHAGFEVAVSQDWGELDKYHKSQAHGGPDLGSSAMSMTTSNLLPVTCGETEGR